jgi:hypothetical protein
MKSLRLLSVIVAAGVLASPVLACGDGPWMGVNLVATPNVKAALRTAYIRAHPELAPERVGMPVSGRTYYGNYSGTRYAVATFAVPSSRAYPTIFRTDFNGRWKFIRQTHGGICTTVVPIELIKVWWLEHWRAGCYLEGRGNS